MNPQPLEDAIDRIKKQWNAERPELDVSMIDVLPRIIRIYLLQSASHFEIYKGFGLMFGEFEVLAALLRNGAPYRLNPRDLMNALVLSSGAMTNRIDRLEGAGFVERLADPDDRRGTLVSLTEAGHKIGNAALTAHLANQELLLQGLSLGDRKQLADLLRKLLLSGPFAELDAKPTTKPVREASAKISRPRRR